MIEQKTGIAMLRPAGDLSDLKELIDGAIKEDCTWGVLLEEGEEPGEYMKEELSDVVSDIPSDIDLVRVIVEHGRDEYDNPGRATMQPRLLRLDGVVEVTAAERSIFCPAERMASLNNVIIHDFSGDNLGQVENEQEDFEQAKIDAVDEEWAPARAHAWLKMASYYLDMDKLEHSIDAAFHAMKACPSLAEPCMILAEVATRQNRTLDSIMWLERVVVMEQPIIFSCIDMAHYTWKPWKYLMSKYSEIGDLDKMVVATKKVLQYRPGDTSVEESQKGAEILAARMKSEDKESRVAIVDFMPSFTRLLGRKLLEVSKVTRHEKYDPRKLAGSTHVFVEWAASNAVAASLDPMEGRRLVVRLHAYEMYTKLVDQIKWDNVDALVFVCDHIKEYVEKTVPNLNTEIHMIPVGVNLSQFPFEPNKRDMNTVAWMGRLNHEKGIDRLIDVSRMNPDIHFKVGGPAQHAAVLRTLHDYIESGANMMYYGNITDVRGFLRDAAFLLNTSTWEGCLVSAAEAAACGCVPLVPDWPGAKKMWPATTFSGIGEFREVYDHAVGEYMLIQSEYYGSVVENRNAENTVPALIDVILGRQADE